MATTNLLRTKIKATSMSKQQEVDFWYGLIKGFEVMCQQLDDDDGVTDTNYEALCFTAIMNAYITNSQGNRVGTQRTNPEGFTHITPRGGFTDTQRHRIMYDYVNMWETLCEKLDADGGVTDVNYEALCFTATFLHIVKDPKGVTDLGNGTVYYFKPGLCNHKQLIEWMYNASYSLELLTTKLDADGGVTDTDYEENTYIEYCVIQVENGAGSVTGNATYN